MSRILEFDGKHLTYAEAKAAESDLLRSPDDDR